MKKDKDHVKIRCIVEKLLDEEVPIEEIADKLNIEIGSRYIKKSAKWYRFCIIAKRNQKKAIEKHPDLYSKAGKISQQKHPDIGFRLGKKYGSVAGKHRAEKIRGDSEYFSKMARRLHELNPQHSQNNMKKAHQTMKKDGTFYIHQRKAALICMKKHPDQFKEMSKKAHAAYSLALLALESRRKNYPYEFMNCLFDSDSERRLCQIFIKYRLIDKPVEGKNVHFKINSHHIDFLIAKKVFVEYHPTTYFKAGKETTEQYYKRRRLLLDDNGYKGYPLIVINRLTNIRTKVKEIKQLLALELD